MIRLSQRLCLIACTLLAVTAASGTPFPEDKVTRFTFPSELGTVWKSSYDFSNGNLAVVLVDDVDAPTVYTLVQKRGLDYAETVFATEVWTAELSENGDTLVVGTVDDKFHVVDGSGQIAWTRSANAIASMKPSLDGSVVTEAIVGEYSFGATSPHHVQVFSSTDGSLVSDVTVPDPTRGVVAINSTDFVVAFPDRIDRYSGNQVIWSTAITDTVDFLRTIGTSHVAVVSPIGRSRVYDLNGNLVFFYDPENLQVPGLSTSSLRQLSPVAGDGSSILFFDQIHLSGVLVKFDISSQSISSHVFLTAYPGEHRPSRTLYEGHLGLAKDNTLQFVDINP